jgi:hypothetical protein
MARQRTDADDQIIETALKRFAESADATKDQRLREQEALNFEFDPWPAGAKLARAAYTYAGVDVPARPMLNIPLLDQPLQLVINQEKAAHLGISVHPETEDADDDTAEINQGIIRHIETRSRANLARSWAFERTVRCGRGITRSANATPVRMRKGRKRSIRSSTSRAFRISSASTTTRGRSSPTTPIGCSRSRS